MGGFGKPCFWDLVRAHRGGIASTYAEVTGAGPGFAGAGEKQSRLETGVPCARRNATERFGPPAARSAAGTAPVRMSVRLRISKIR